MLREQQLHRMSRDRHRPNGVSGLRRAHYQFSVSSQYGFVYGYGSFLNIQICPEKGQQFTAPQAADQLQVKHGKHISVRCSLQIGAHLLRLQDVHFLLLQPGRFTVVGRVLGKQSLLYRLFQSAVEQHMPDRTQRNVWIRNYNRIKQQCVCFGICKRGNYLPYFVSFTGSRTN